MRRTLILLSTLVLTLGLSFSVPGSAQAFGGESLACHVNNGSNGSPECGPPAPAGSYTVVFQVLGGSGTYGYSWSVNATPVAGCTSTSNSCLVSAASVSHDQEIDASVTISQSGQFATLHADAVIPATCGQLGGVWVYC
jgi:hypothetical protein